MTGKKKRRGGRKVQREQEPASISEAKFSDEATEQIEEELATVSISDVVSEGKEEASITPVEVVDSNPPALQTSVTVLPTAISSKLGVSLPQEAWPSFVFSAGQNPITSPLNVAEPEALSAQMADSTAVCASRPRRQAARRRGGKCPTSERFGKLGKSRQQILQPGAQEVAFGQGRDPLSLVVSYEESGLRRIVRVPEGCTSETIVDSALRQAVAGAALDSAGWQEALNQPKEDGYFTYSTVPEGLTVAKFREMKGKVLVTPLTAESGLWKLKEEAEKKRTASEEVIKKVRDYLLKLESEHKKTTAENEHSEEENSACTHCKTMRTHLNDLLQIVTPKGDPFLI